MGRSGGVNKKINKSSSSTRAAAVPSNEIYYESEDTDSGEYNGLKWNSKTELKRNKYGEVVKITGKTAIKNSRFSIEVMASAAKDEDGNPEKIVVRKTRIGLKQQGTYSDGSPDMDYGYITTEEPVSASDIKGSLEEYAAEQFKIIFEERMDRDIKEQKKLEEKMAGEKRKREGNYTAEEQIRILKNQTP